MMALLFSLSEELPGRELETVPLDMSAVPILSSSSSNMLNAWKGFVKSGLVNVRAVFPGSVSFVRGKLNMFFGLGRSLSDDSSDKPTD